MLSKRIPCKKCRAKVLQETIDHCAGMCMPCYQRSSEFADSIEKEFQEWASKSDYRSILESAPSGLPQLTDDVVQTFQSKHKIALPSDFLQLLLYQNGGYVHQWALKDEYLFTEVYGISNEPLDLNEPSIISSVYECWTLCGGEDFEQGMTNYKDLLERLFIFDSDGHSYTCLDYRNGNDCSGIVAVGSESGFDGHVEELSKDFKSLFNIWD